MRNVNLGLTMFVRRLEMSKLAIKDLNVTEELSADAARKISGGFLLTGLAITTGLVLVAAKHGVFDSVVETKDDGVYVGGHKL